MNENIIVPPPPLHPLLADRNRGRGVQTQITGEKNSDKGVFCWFFFLQLYFLRYKMVETFIGGGGGATFYYFSFLGGGGLGGANPYFYRNLYNL